MKPWNSIIERFGYDRREARLKSTAVVHGSLRERYFEKRIEHERIYAIGDIHGEFDLFCEALRLIKSDNGRRSPANSVILLLGDVVDRGSRSRQMLEMLQRFHTTSSGLLVLRGNHEEMLLQSARGDEAVQRLWLRSGGRQTLESYGIVPDDFTRCSPLDRAKQLSAALGDETLRWLEGRPLSYRSGDYFFCHAGVKPGIDLGKQSTKDLLWIRNRFLFSDADHGAVVVHGHTEVCEPEILHNRINIDTGAYRSGRLSVIGLQGPERWLLRATLPHRSPMRTRSKLKL